MFRLDSRVKRVRDGALLRLHLSPLLDMSKVVRDTIADTPIETASKSLYAEPLINRAERRGVVA
jgi:hypothetical protein